MADNPLSQEEARIAIDAMNASGQLQPSISDFLDPEVVSAARAYWMKNGGGASSFDSFVRVTGR